MKLLFRFWPLLVVFYCVSFAAAQSQTDSSLIVTIDSGRLEGAHFGVGPDELMFLGIPFAAPPTGELRWEPPQPVEKWQGTRMADGYGGDCFDTEDPQADDITKEMVQTVDPYFTYRYDEDCLYLNVWTQGDRVPRTVELVLADRNDERFAGVVVLEAICRLRAFL